MGPKVGLWWGNGLFESRRDDQIGVKNTESVGPTSQGEKTPRLRRCVSSSSSSSGASFLFLLPPPPPSFCEISAAIYHFFSFILFLHLLVIYAHTWVCVPSATLSGALWAAVALIALSRGHVHINGVRVLAVYI